MPNLLVTKPARISGPKIVRGGTEDSHVCLDSEQRTHKAQDPDKDRMLDIAAQSAKVEMEYDPSIHTGELPNRISAQQERDRMHLRVPSRHEKKDMEIEEMDREEMRRKGRYRTPPPNERERWYQQPLPYDPHEAEIKRDPGKRIINGEDYAKFYLRHAWDIPKYIEDHPEDLIPKK
ncbi:hypothetical protein LshimejAT787_1400700 [Lyophyllum shimeji]|uniref:Uncharacterized protein n=1 Tax=Lyophyllum shimeji TaxID=47721 RepID=A0A9P3PX27_LYOSH|nr:hypothetical protein LshimejAT787_1400700 [Lyophyllum shimeji]